MITDHAEGTIESLRYNLGGDRPSQTTRLTLFLHRIHGSRLEFNQNKGGISLTTPPKLAPRLRSLPPMLHMLHLCPMSNCSKAPRGLFVLLRTDGIFTVNALSPSSSLRQFSHHYSIRAGQNLPDKEFRYLRTVIVTAAVHWGFSSKLSPLTLTFQHRAGVTPYTSTFVLAESCVFGKQLHGLLSCGPLTVLTTVCE